MITPRQSEVLQFIVDYIAIKNHAPSIREIMHGTHMKSTSTVSGILLRLEDRGVIQRLKKKHRAIEILKLPTRIATDEQVQVQENNG
jgi:repressor LexA